MKAKHTPGPWHVGGTAFSGGRALQSIWGPTQPQAQSGEWIAKDVSPANAALIARAPEMAERIERLERDRAALLEACKAVIAHDKRYGRSYKNPTRSSLMDKVEAVIQAAEAD